MTRAAHLRAIHRSGPLIHEPETVTALALLFERVYLPNDIEPIREFAKLYRFEDMEDPTERLRLRGPGNPLSDLTRNQQTVVLQYLDQCLHFCQTYQELFGPVFETNLWEAGAFCVSRNHDGAPSGPPGYVPIGTVPGVGFDQAVPIKQLASLLAIEAVKLVVPRFAPASPHDILEARERLREHLPPFWAAMFRLSGELEKRLTTQMPPPELLREVEELTDLAVRPALIELERKLELERRNWFFKILAPVGRFVRLLIGGGGLASPNLLPGAVASGSEVALATADVFHTIHNLRREQGLVFLLEVERRLKE